VTEHPPPRPDDQVLARRAALGDRAAFADIVHRHGPGMFRYATTMLDGNTHDAEDGVQDALTKAWQHLPRFRAEASLQTWMYRITANEVLAARRPRRPVPIDDQLLAPLPAPAQDQPEQRLNRSRCGHRGPRRPRHDSAPARGGVTNQAGADRAIERLPADARVRGAGLGGR